MGMDRWDRRAGGLRVTCSSCPPRLPQAASAGVILSALPAWLSVWQMRAVGCYPQGLRMRAPPSVDSIMLSSALPPAALTMPQLSAVLTPKAEVPACVSSVT